MGKSRPAVGISHLRKAYGPVTAVDDISFSVGEGEIFGILGPNGAGRPPLSGQAQGRRDH
jgi:ABC-2 type transport system ATP-binding protein